MFVDERGNGSQIFFENYWFRAERVQFYGSLLVLASQSPFDEAQKIENTLKNTHTTTQKQIPTMISAIPKNTQLLEFN